MSSSRIRALWGGCAALLVLSGLGCGKTDAGTEAGNGECNIMKRAAIAAPFAPSAQGDEPPICGGSREARKNIAFIADMDNCVCDRAEDLAGKLVDVDAQRALLEERNDGKDLIPGCKETDAEKFFLTDAVGCFQLGYLNGFVKGSIQGLGGNGHDGDEHPELCPIGPENQGLHDGESPVHFSNREIDLRVGDTLTAEWQWCRWFGGPFAIAADPTHDPPLPGVFWQEFRPQHGERISVVGDWVIDWGHTELHEVRFGATVRPQPGVPDVWHLLTSGFFARNTAQQNLLAMDIPVPRSSDPLKTELQCTLVESVATRCFSNGIESPRITADAEKGVCKVRIERKPGSAGEEALSERYCGDTHRKLGWNGPDVQCPCFSWNGERDPAGAEDHLDMVCAERGITDFSTINRCTFDGFRKDSPFYSQSHPERVSRIAFAGDIRAKWTAPAGVRAAQGANLWSCNCACDDPSKPGATVVARVQGCALAGGQADDDVAGPEVCAQVCGGEFCGGDSDCRLGQCRAARTGDEQPAFVAWNACTAPPPQTRVAHAGDYRIDLNFDESFIEVGEVDGDGDFTALGRGRLSGSLWTNVAASAAGRELEFANFELFSEDFTVIKKAGPVTVGKAPVEDAYSFTATRFRADMPPEESDTSFIVLPGRMQLGVRAKVDGATGGSLLLNEGALTGAFEPDARTFSMDGHGQGPEGKAVRFHLRGDVVNVPPVANPGPDRVVECTSPKGTPVTLDGRASSDPDGQPIAHHQWFEGAVGLGNEATQTALATLGPHRYDLHVYDANWASDRETLSVNVQDTTPPDLGVSVAPVCLWPPNHRFALFKLGKQLSVGLSDACDAEPEVKIISVKSDEPADAPGSGSTDPDVRFGPTTACVRAERTGTGVGRHYTVELEARDDSGNVSRNSVRVFVPHDASGQPGCQKALGLDELSEACDP
ncbi:hypothetical protein [Archangium sp.]|uniref:hypothetical protein n=1 Tax=Archangium sp. TaxID=1872627 RepID=UPI00286A3BC5|nr:hypothetical protein [Archangium sp.]